MVLRGWCALELRLLLPCAFGQRDEAYTRVVPAEGLEIQIFYLYIYNVGVNIY